MSEVMIAGRDTGTLGKAMDVLQVIADASAPLRFTDLLAQIDQPRGTLHRQIANLIGEGLVVVRRDQTYELGLRLLNLAARSWSQSELRAIAEPVLRRLHDETSETIHLGVLRGAEVIYLDKVESRQTVRMHSQIGNVSPAYCTGVGKAALSTLSDHRVRALLADIQFLRFTPSTLSDSAALIGELHDIRRLGHSFDREEHEAGIHCIAAPIASPDGHVVAGISITAPTYRVPMKQLSAWSTLLQQAARTLNEEISARMTPRA